MKRPAQAMVEFALVVSVFMLLVLATFDLARFYLAYTVVTNAVREASHYAAANVGDTATAYTVLAAQKAGMNLAIGIDTSQFSLTPALTPVITGGVPYMSATGTYHFQSITPWVSVLLNPPSGGPITITVTTSTPVG